MPVKKSELYAILWEACNKLRGGVEPSRYKDYVLVLLFFKYVSDKYKGQKYATFIIDEKASFDQLVNLKGKKNIGEEVDKIMQSFLEKNDLVGLLPDVSFNNQAELGEGKELVDKLTGLIALFENPALDFKSNRASGDDIIGDAYEFFMMKFAQESGKSKGQFYTPSEVSRVVAKLIGINNIKKEVGKTWDVYDPACGSGSLLIRAADEAPKDKNGDSIVSIYGQEKYQDTAGLAKMNFILHNKSTGVVRSGNTLSNPKHINEFKGFKELRTFDFIVMNPPFSDKDWADGLNPAKDVYRRFDGFGTPPDKNGDFAWFLHVLKSLNTKGKAGIILPHGVLFRGNAEETIRKEIIHRKYIKGIIGLPINLFYGTGIPAAIILVDKENTEEREGIFFIDASRGFKKDGNKNRLREQDIEKIVQTYQHQTEIPGYSRFVSYKEIEETNAYNLNIPRYIQALDESLPQSIQHHLQGGIPKEDVDSLEKLWEISPQLKNKIFDYQQDGYRLKGENQSLEEIIANDENVLKEKKIVENLFSQWMTDVANSLQSIDGNTQPKALIQDISLNLLQKYTTNKLLDPYVVYDCLLNYWNEIMQDDIYIIKSSGYEAAREVEYEYKVSKGKTTKTVNGFEGLLLPTRIIEKEYFSSELEELNALEENIITIEAELDTLREEQSGEEGLLVNVLNIKGDAIPKALLSARLSELEKMKVSSTLTRLEEIVEALVNHDTKKVERILRKNSELGQFDLKNKSGLIGKEKVQVAIKLARQEAKIPEQYADEYNMLLAYRDKLSGKEKLEKELKQLRSLLDSKVIAKYAELTLEEIKVLLLEKKWFAVIKADILEAVEQELNTLASKVTLIAKRYAHTLTELEANVLQSEKAVKDALERMGYTW